MLEVTVEAWEDDEYVIVIKGIGVTGGTLHKREAHIVRDQLQNKAGLAEIINELYEEPHVLEDLRSQIKIGQQITNGNCSMPEKQWYIEVIDDELNHYVIPEEREDEWYEWVESDPDPNFAPEWVEKVTNVRFSDWENVGG